MDIKKHIIETAKKDGIRVSRSDLNNYLSGARNAGIIKAKAISDAVDSPCEIWIDPEKKDLRKVYIEEAAKRLNLPIYFFRGKPKNAQ